ncbi:MAG: putative addiction module component (TIGR02574 family) [Polaribacter sp.]|jgi:putative addiction module component (TIGR02574 family)
MTVQNLKKAVRSLSTQERILFAQYILDTVAEDTNNKNSGEALSDVWIEEIDKRSSSYKGRKVNTVTWDEVKAKVIRKNS